MLISCIASCRYLLQGLVHFLPPSDIVVCSMVFAEAGPWKRNDALIVAVFWIGTLVQKISATAGKSNVSAPGKERGRRTKWPQILTTGLINDSATRPGRRRTGTTGATTAGTIPDTRKEIACLNSPGVADDDALQRWTRRKRFHILKRGLTG